MGPAWRRRPPVAPRKGGRPIKAPRLVRPVRIAGIEAFKQAFQRRQEKREEARK